MIDFRTLSLDEQVDTLLNHVEDLEDDSTEEVLTRNMILEQIGHGMVVVEVEEFAIAAMRPKGWRAVNGNSVLWLLFVTRDSRGRGIGRAFVQRLKIKYERQLPMILLCNGSSREAFFRACGFSVKNRLDHGKTVMHSNLNES